MKKKKNLSVINILKYLWGIVCLGSYIYRFIISNPASEVCVWVSSIVFFLLIIMSWMENRGWIKPYKKKVPTKRCKWVDGANNVCLQPDKYGTFCEGYDCARYEPMDS